MIEVARVSPKQKGLAISNTSSGSQAKLALARLLELVRIASSSPPLLLTSAERSGLNLENPSEDHQMVVDKAEEALTGTQTQSKNSNGRGRGDGRGTGGRLTLRKFQEGLKKEALSRKEGGGS